MKDPNDIIIYHQITQHNRLYQFLAGIDESFDKDRRDLLLQDPLPIVEEAYASIWRKVMRRDIMKKEPSSEIESSGMGEGFVVKRKPHRRKDDKIHLRCTDCGSTRHTKNECFKLVDYPEWWPDTKKKGTKESQKFLDIITGRAAIGLSKNGDIISEEEREEGVALNSTIGNKEREREIISHKRRIKGERGIRVLWEPIAFGMAYFKERRKRGGGVTCPLKRVTFLLLVLLLYLFSEVVGSSTVGPQTPCLMTLMTL